MSVIEAVDLVVGYEGRRLVSNCSFALNSGIHVLLGQNGSGKSTLLKTIAGILKPLSGRVLIGGADIHSLKPKDRVKMVAYAWQNPFHGFVSLTVEDEIAFMNRMSGIDIDWRVVRMLVPDELMSRNPFRLSGGEARRVALASVLCGSQKVWLLDEPFNDLDYDGFQAVRDVIEYGRRSGRTVIVSLHQVAIADTLSPDAFMLIKDGRLAIGDWSDLSDDVLVSANIIPRHVFRAGGLR